MQMPEMSVQPGVDRPIVMMGNSIGLALMCAEDVPSIARWNQDLKFTARIGTPGEAHTLEMRQEFCSRIKPDSAEFSVIELSSGRLAGFGGLFDITRALVGTAFVGIGESDLRRKGYGTEAGRLICGTSKKVIVCIEGDGKAHVSDPGLGCVKARIGTLRLVPRGKSSL
jgi:RimJ/RimL family protein N-acetyltransferase